jgi:SAM-dependent methyltransferase
MTEFLSSGYWSERYTSQQTGWDLGVISPPIKAYVDQLTDRAIRILIPGCGNGYEGIYLHEMGFRNVHLLDLSPKPIDGIRKHYPSFPKNNMHVQNFFEHQGDYDLIIEQTLFCAIDPSLRNRYAKHALKLLHPGGKLVGVFFDRLFEGGPPFGGSKSEYKELFAPLFSVVKMETCYNSIEPRKGTELFVELQK